MSPKKDVAPEEVSELVDLQLPTTPDEADASVEELQSEGHLEEDHQGEFKEQAPSVGFNQDRALKILESLEHDIRTLRGMLSGSGEGFTPQSSSLQGFMTPASYSHTSQFYNEDDGIEGIFDGERMVDANGKSYQVPPNYASKSKLIEGDPLKLYIGSDGKYVYKQLGPVERRNVGGVLRMEGNHYVVDSDEGHTYSILTACVTYYMALYSIKAGDRVMIMIPATGIARWAVIDNPA